MKRLFAIGLSFLMLVGFSADGAERATQLSRPIVAEVREIMGFLNPNGMS
jgi:hypothetical protein